MAKTQFAGPIRTGKTIGIPTQNTTGTLLAYQQATVESGALKNYIVTPADCQPIDMTLLVKGSAGQVGGVDIRIGTSADATHYTNFPVSAVGFYPLTRASVSAQAWIDGFGASAANIVAIVASAPASGAALVGFSAVVGISYIQRS